jgi:hypothetical protein
VRKHTFNAAVAAAGTDAAMCRKTAVCSKPWIDSGNWFVWGNWDTMAYSALLDNGGNVVGTWADEKVVGYDGSNPGTTWFIASAYDEGEGVYATALRYKLDDATVVPARITAIRTTYMQSLEAQDVMLIPGAMPMFWDGVDCVEQGFIRPEPPEVGVPPGAGGNLSAGDYYYTQTYRWRDAYNRLHESAPSAPVKVTTVLNDLVPLRPRFTAHTHKDHVEVVIWRTEVNKVVFHRLQSWENNKQLDQIAVAWNDTIADTVLALAENLYTTGSSPTLENVKPRAHKMQCIHQNRHVYVDDENPDTRLYYSKVFSPLIGIEHSDSLPLTVPPDGGDITAVWSFSDYLFVAKRHRIYIFRRNGLNSLGAGLGYDGPELYSESIGCDSPKGVVLAGTGIMWRGHDRIWGINKQLQIQPLGEPVRYWTDSQDGGQLTLSGAVQLPDQHLAVWFHTGTYALVYDYLYGLWSLWTMLDATDAVEAGGVLWWKYASGHSLRYLNTALYKDNAAFQSLNLETGQIALDGPLGIQQLYRLLLGLYNKAGHTINVQYQWDYDPEWKDADTFDSTSLAVYYGIAQFMGAGAGSYADDAYLLDVEFPRGRATAVRLKIYDTPAVGSTGESFEIVLIGVEAGVHVSGRRVPRTHQAS